MRTASTGLVFKGFFHKVLHQVLKYGIYITKGYQVKKPIVCCVQRTHGKSRKTRFFSDEAPFAVIEQGFDLLQMSGRPTFAGYWSDRLGVEVGKLLFQLVDAVGQVCALRCCGLTLGGLLLCFDALLLKVGYFVQTYEG